MYIHIWAVRIQIFQIANKFLLMHLKKQCDNGENVYVPHQCNTD
ncbi:MAG: hypothetical protein HCAMLNBO_02021 [Candidatus Brocadia fulgida]|nr:hypothetical protein [Candidatus Brocadia fulgida]